MRQKRLADKWTQKEQTTVSSAINNVSIKLHIFFTDLWHRYKTLPIYNYISEYRWVQQQSANSSSKFRVYDGSCFVTALLMMVWIWVKKTLNKLVKRCAFRSGTAVDAIFIRCVCLSAFCPLAINTLRRNRKTSNGTHRAWLWFEKKLMHECINTKFQYGKL